MDNHAHFIFPDSDDLTPLLGYYPNIRRNLHDYHHSQRNSTPRKKTLLENIRAAETLPPISLLTTEEIQQAEEICRKDPKLMSESAKEKWNALKLTYNNYTGNGCAISLKRPEEIQSPVTMIHGSNVTTFEQASLEEHILCCNERHEAAFNPQTRAQLDDNVKFYKGFPATMMNLVETIRNEIKEIQMYLYPDKENLRALHAEFFRSRSQQIENGDTLEVKSTSEFKQKN